ncbi:MAG: ATP-binding protein [Acidobacteriota bacterium]
MGARRQSTRDSTSAKLVSQFLAEMDGFTQDNHGVLVLAATNVPWSVDGAFLRPGRFDRTLFVPPPDREAREVILDIHLRERPHEDGLDLKDLSRRTKGFSGADLEALVEEAADLAIEDTLEKGEEVPMTTRHLKEALGELRPTTLDWLSTARNHARYADEGGRYREVLDFLDRFGK